jgi:hypothetical protein
VVQSTLAPAASAARSSSTSPVWHALMSLSSLEGIFLAVGALAQQPMYCRRDLWERVSHRATRQRAPHGARVQGRARRSGSWGGGSGVAELRVRAKLQRGARCAAPARIGAR